MNSKEALSVQIPTNSVQSNILVSISCITYNHAPYIRQCLDGFLMQQCNFSFEILIHDDASTDETQKIIVEYKEKHPEIIKPIFQSKNQYSKGVRGIMARFNFPRAIGKYIALCEGDDYWTDPLKLQKQVDFMEKNEEYSVCVHQAEVIEGTTSKLIRLNTPRENSAEYNFSQIVRGGGGLFATNSMLCRAKFIANLPSWMLIAQVGDFPLLIHLALSGKVWYMSSVMSAYRLGAPGSWTSKVRKEPSFNASNYQALALMLAEINKETNFRYQKVLEEVVLKYQFICHILLNDYHAIKEAKYSEIYKKYLSSLSFKGKIAFFMKSKVPLLWSLINALRENL